MADLCNINSTQRFLNFLPCYKHFSEGTPNHNCFVYGKLKLQKSSFRGSSQILSNFPFVNLQIKSIVESVRPIMSCTQSMKKISDLLKKYAFWGKKN